MSRRARERPPAAGGSGQALRLDAVRHVYESVTGEPVVALERIDLDVATGSFVTLVGPSGCGKSTLLQLVAGFIHPTEGTISAADQPVRGPGQDRGVVFQQPTSLLPWQTVRQNVELGHACAVSPSPSDERVPTKSCNGSGSASSPTAPSTSSPVACSSAPRSPECWPTIPTSC